MKGVFTSATVFEAFGERVSVRETDGRVKIVDDRSGYSFTVSPECAVELARALKRCVKDMKREGEK